MEWKNWKCPINLISQGIETKYDGEVMEAIARVGIDIDKEELIKCINYDRNQYEKGYKQGSTWAFSKIENEIKYLMNCGAGKKKSLNHLLHICEEEMGGKPNE